MTNLIDLILANSNVSQEHALCGLIADHTERLVNSRGLGIRDLVYQAEKVVEAEPARAFKFDSEDQAILAVNGDQWQAGRFEPLSIGELKARIRKNRATAVKSFPRLWVLDGASPATDIGSLQGTSDARTLFQVASQFNCLESPGPTVTRVSKYFSDYTQGPRASISAFPGSLLRTYQAPGSGSTRFVQRTDAQQIDLLVDACEEKLSDNGYFTGHGLRHPESAVAALESNFDRIRVGIHENVQVVLGYDWDGLVEDSDQRLITQVFTSTVAGGWYGAEQNLGDGLFPLACRHLLRAAYLGTLLAAIYLNRSRIVLTLIGGGVFSNPVDLIWKSIQWALEQVQPFMSSELDVVLNGYGLHHMTNLEENILPAVRARKGLVLTFNSSGLSTVLR